MISRRTGIGGYTTRWFLPSRFPDCRLEEIPQAHRLKRFAAPLRGELFSSPQPLEPIHRRGVGSALWQLAEFRTHRTSFGEPEGNRSEGFVVAFQVSSERSNIETTEDPAQPIIADTGASLLVCLFEVIEPDDAPGNEEIRKEPHRIPIARSPRVLAADHYEVDCFVAPQISITHPALHVRMDTQPMHFAAQPARLPLTSEMTSCYEIE